MQVVPPCLFQLQKILPESFFRRGPPLNLYSNLYSASHVHGEQAEFFTRAVVDGKVLHCEHYSRSSRRKNSVVGLSDGKVVQLKGELQQKTKI